MRGKLGRGYIDMTAGGITPGHAGKTKSQSHLIPSTRDHPRACGENLQGGILIETPEGSPPRMRGKLFGNDVFPWLILVLSLNPL